MSVDHLDLVGRREHDLGLALVVANQPSDADALAAVELLGSRWERVEAADEDDGGEGASPVGMEVEEDRFLDSASLDDPAFDREVARMEACLRFAAEV